jgi:very-short-patch-repair endonuclease
MTAIRPRQRSAGSVWEERLLLHLCAANLHHGCIREYVFAPPRRFRADFAWPEQRLLVEVQGGIWTRGKASHSSGAGVSRDAEKLNTATLAGWRVLQVTSDHIRSGDAVAWIAQALAAPQRGAAA